MSKYKQYLQSALADLMQLPEEQISLSAPLSEQGVDSLIGLRLARKMNELTGAEIDLEWIYDYPSIDLLAQFLEERFSHCDVTSL
jgi:acyl carrier protein